MPNVTTTKHEVVTRSIIPRRDALTSSIKSYTTRGDEADPTGAITDRVQFDLMDHVHFTGVRLREKTFHRIVLLMWFLLLFGVAVAIGTLPNPAS